MLQQPIMVKVVFAFCLLGTVAMGQQLTIGFTADSYLEEEGTGSVMVRVRKTGVNGLGDLKGNLAVMVTPMTYGEFDGTSNFSLPREIPRPDPAECKHGSIYALHMCTLVISLQSVIGLFCHTTASAISSCFPLTRSFVCW